jgi:thiosulfate/3-mercaptopyruvate sulfurtransferase
MRREFMMAMVSVLAFVGLFVAGAYAGHDSHWGRKIDPIVSTDWLEDNLELENLLIIDIRSPDDYGKEHIPGSINEPFVTAFDATCRGPSSNWIVGSEDCLWLQLPEKEDLFKTIGNLGITKHSLVVIVTAPNPDEPPFYGLSNATRVALTLIYAGVSNVAILDGGYSKWVADGKAITTDAPTVTPVTYRGKVKEEMFVSRKYVRKHIGEAVIIDARDANIYFGEALEPFADKLGHIPTARSLPAPWMWELQELKTDTETYTYYLYKDKKILEAMAIGVIGKHSKYRRHRNEEIIVYCGVGGYASSWWFVLTQVLGYEDVEVYDGSAQEWVRYYDMVPYQWD